MAIDLSSNTQPVAFARTTLHATAGNLDVLTLPTWCRQVTISAIGTGNIKITHTGSQDAAIGSNYYTILNGEKLSLRNVRLHNTLFRVTGTVNSDPVEFILEETWSE